MLGLGLDSGSTTTKAALFDGEKVVATKLVPTTANPRESLRVLYEELYTPGVGYVVTTGYGRELLDQSDKHITEITCHAKGATFLCDTATAVVDVGGQDSKVILLDRDQNVVDFLMNDKCAAGTGRFIEVMMRILEEDLSGIDAFVAGHKPVSITSMCTVFAESEIISLLAQGVDKADIALGVVDSICKRTAYFVQRLSPSGDVFFSGGLAGFPVFRQTLEEYLGLPVKTHPLSQFAGAIGAAIIAHGKGKQRK